nr:MAG: hypothetical protein [Wufeng shrew polycipivirus 2]
MNGARFTASTGMGSFSTSLDTNLPFLSNPMGYSFFGLDSGASSSQTRVSRNVSLSSSASADTTIRAESASNTRTAPNLDNLWGIGKDNSIIDDDAERDQNYESTKNDLADEYSSGPSLDEASKSTAIEEETGSEAVLDTAEAVEGIEGATPWGMAAIINQQIGSSVNSVITAQQQTQSSQDYMNNMNQHGVNVSLNAGLIRDQQDNTIRNQQAYGNFGSLFGPIGTMVGRDIAGTVQAPSGVFNTAASSSGWINPTDTVAANSASSATQSGQSTMDDNIDND